MSEKPWDQYGEYLGLELLLSAQRPRSHAAGQPAHDEMLFIQFHQICELWFAQVLFELGDIQARFSRSVVDDRDMGPILLYLSRVVQIFRQLESMIDVLETMPPQSFVDFREHLGTGSGFQSLQFRLIETRLGLRREDRLPVFHGQFDDKLQAASRAAIAEEEKTPSLFVQLDEWLARTPFVDLHAYKFQDEYRRAVHVMFEEKEKAAEMLLSGTALENELALIRRGLEKFEGIFDAARHEKARAAGQWRMSLKALQAALFINIYREEPMLQGPCNLLTAVMDVDELMARWRCRHALMVQRMVGLGAGTGGSSGYEYLARTFASHRIFTDLFSLSSYLIPSRARPPLPDSVSHAMGYKYSMDTKS